METRTFGKTDERLSIIGFGGIVIKDTQPAEASRLVGNAIDRGINYFDVAPSYGDAQECLGPALEPYRNQVFLACKTGKRDGESAKADLHESIKLLRTDTIDLYQLHGMKSWKDYDQALAPGGALEAIIEAREKGQLRYIGFSAHSDEVALALIDQFDFDSVLFPVNWVNYIKADFGPRVVAKAYEKGIGRLALKALAKSRIPKGDPRPFERCWYEPVVDRELASLALRFTLSQPITSAIPPGDPKLFQMALELADEFTPITDEEIQLLEKIAKKNRPLASEDWIISTR